MTQVNMSMANDRQPSLFVLGTSHHSTPLEVRECFALTPEVTRSLYKDLKAGGTVDECLILNTCNRVEIYGVADEADCRNTLRESLSRHQSPEGAQAFMQHSFWKTGEEAVRHAFELTSGLDSQMVGETEILGQVKNAYGEAMAHATTGPVLNRVFQKSFQAAKWIRTHTAIGKGQVSIGNVATELAMRVCGELSESSVLLIGTGEVGEKTAQALLGRGAGQITVASRNPLNARRIADQLHGAIIAFNDVPRLLQYFDIVICSTSAPGTILSSQEIAPVIKQRSTRPLFLIDLAVPRDIDPAAGKLTNVYLYNVDDLATIANENLKARMAEMEHCRKALSQKAAAVWGILLQRMNGSENGEESAS